MKIHILGASGVGVTTLGQALAKRLQLSYFDSDDYFWLPTDPPFTTQRPAEERNTLLKSDLDKAQNWVWGGSAIRWGFFPQCDGIVFLWAEPEVRIARLEARERTRYGEKISKDPTYQKKYEAFLAWAAAYDDPDATITRTIKNQEEWLKKQNTPILELRDSAGGPGDPAAYGGGLTVEERLEKVLHWIGREK